MEWTLLCLTTSASLALRAILRPTSATPSRSPSAEQPASRSDSGMSSTSIWASSSPPCSDLSFFYHLSLARADACWHATSVVFVAGLMPLNWAIRKNSNKPKCTITPNASVNHHPPRPTTSNPKAPASNPLSKRLRSKPCLLLPWLLLTTSEITPVAPAALQPGLSPYRAQVPAISGADPTTTPTDPIQFFLQG